MSELVIKPLNLALFLEMAKSKSGFAFARYGDGTFYCMQGHKGKNCDGVIYTEAQAAALIETLYDTSITHSIGNLAISEAGAAEWLDEKGIELGWYDCNVLNTASYRGDLHPFILFLQARTSILIGPPHVARMANVFPVAEAIICHPTKAFEQLDELASNAYAAAVVEDADVILISAGVGAGPTLVSRLHSALPNKVILDVGSLWDMYVGVMSRKKAKKLGKLKIERLARANFRQGLERLWII